MKMDEIDPIYFEKSYYLSPDDGGVKRIPFCGKHCRKRGKLVLQKL